MIRDLKRLEVLLQGVALGLPTTSLSPVPPTSREELGLKGRVTWMGPQATSAPDGDIQAPNRMGTSEKESHG